MTGPGGWWRRPAREHPLAVAGLVILLVGVVIAALTLTGAHGGRGSPRGAASATVAGPPVVIGTHPPPQQTCPRQTTSASAGSPTAPAPACTTESTMPDDESSAGVHPRTPAQQLVAAATAYAARYLSRRHDQLRGVEDIGPAVKHAGWQTVLVTYTARRAGRGDTSADLLLELARRHGRWTVVRAQ